MLRRRRVQLTRLLAGAQLIDAAGNELVPRRYIDEHLDRLGVPRELRPLLTPIKVASSFGLLIGTRLPRLGALTSSCLVVYYAAAVRFHVRAEEHSVFALPAAAFGVAAALTLLTVYLPAVKGCEGRP